MPTITLDPKLAAALDLIAESEGTCSSPATLADGYDIIVTGVDGPNNFTDYSHHPFSLGRPPILVRPARPAVYGPQDPDSIDPPAILAPARHPLFSTASGRYQITRSTWEHLRETYKLGTFSPQAQDLACVHLLDECKATSLFAAGEVVQAIEAAADVWASFPGNLYPQGGRPITWLLQKYQEILKRNR